MATPSVKDKIFKLKNSWDSLKLTSYYKTYGFLKWEDIENTIETYLSICKEANYEEKKILVTIIGKEVFDQLSAIKNLNLDTQIIPYTSSQNKILNDTSEATSKIDYRNPRILIEIPSLSNSNGPAYIRIRRMRKPHNKKLEYVMYGTLVSPPPEITYNKPEESTALDFGYIKLFKLDNAILYIRVPTRITDIEELGKGNMLEF